MSILISFIIPLAIYNLHYLDCANMFNILANKNISDENTAKYMNAYIDKFGLIERSGISIVILASHPRSSM